MNPVLQGLEPQAVFTHFESLCQIPHGSYNVGAIADFCEAFAQKRGLDCIRDDADNLIITVPASAGYEKAEPIVIQGHLDMVCEKRPESTHNFDTDPLKLVVEDGFVRTKDTTLGGDDGIAIAMAMAIMDDSSIPHAKLFCVFTTNEEVGMVGAHAMDCTPFAKATRMINIDSEAEGVICAGCAGGASVESTYPLRFVKAKGLRATVKISGLVGGHSGECIKYFRMNANTLLGQALYQIGKVIDFSIISLNGGNKENAIPREAIAEILIGPNEQQLLSDTLTQLTQTFQRVAGSADPDVTVSAVFDGTKEYQVFGPDTEDMALHVLMDTPNGVHSMNRIRPDMVDMSLNLGILRTIDNTMVLNYGVRGNLAESRDMICDQLTSFTKHSGGTVKISDVYPSWDYKADSPLQKVMIEQYAALYGKTPTIEVIHAGLECGLISERLPHLDIVSIGPNLYDIHTFEEHMEIASVERIWKYLLAVLAVLK